MTGVPVTQVRQDIRTVDVVARSAGPQRLDPVVEATVQRARPVLLTALGAVLAFIPLTSSVFWGSMACTLLGGTAAGTVLTLVFLPALYAIGFRVQKPVDAGGYQGPALPG